MKSNKFVNGGSPALNGALLAAFWTLVCGLFHVIKP